MTEDSRLHDSFRMPRSQRRRNAKRNAGRRDMEHLGEEIKEVFDQMDFIYSELEVVVHTDSFVFSNAELSDLDASLDYIYEQVGKWLVGYCGALVQREQNGSMDIDALESLLDRLLGICYQMDAWIQLVASISIDPTPLYGFKQPPVEHSTDVRELERRCMRVREVQAYLIKLRHRHQSHLLYADRRPFAELTPADLDKMGTRYARLLQSSFPSTPIRRLSDYCARLSIDNIPNLLGDLYRSSMMAAVLSAQPNLAALTNMRAASNAEALANAKKKAKK